MDSPAAQDTPPPPVQHHGKLDRCPNCGAPLGPADNFCPRCGQENHDLHLPLRHLLAEAAEGLLHFDNMSLRTITALVTKPGLLTAEFAAGRRRRYVPPIRLYIFLSFVFFLTLSLTASHPDADAAARAESAQASETAGMKISFHNINADELKGLAPAQIDSLMAARSMARTGFNRFVVAQLARITSGGKAEFNHLLVKGVSYMMFVLMPLFALFLLLFYRRKETVYLDHLVFSVHFHSFAFLLLTLYVVANRLGSSTMVMLLVALLIGAYLFLALRRFYRQRPAVTLLKTLSIGILHFFAIGICFFFTVFLSVMAF